MFKYPEYELYAGEKYAGSEGVNLLVVITDPGDMPSIALFDTKNNITEFTAGRGSFFASVSCSNQDDALSKVQEFNTALIAHCNEYHKTKNTNKLVKLAAPKPETPKPVA